MKSKNIWSWLIPFFLIIIIIFSLPYLITTRYWFEIDFSDSGEIGDTLGGIMGPFIAIIASLLTFGAFWVQYQANIEQREQFEKQLLHNETLFNQQLASQKSEIDAHENLIKVDRFETRFFELIKLHKENVNEININHGLIQGRKAFVYLFEEFRFSYYILKAYIDKEALNEWFPKDTNFNKDDEDTITNLAYLIFFIGVGSNSDPLLRSYTNNVCSNFFLERILELYKNHQVVYSSIRKNILSHPDSEKTETIIGKKRIYPRLKVQLNDNVEFEYIARFKPFSGHISNLGHYFRHLFQTIKYVDQFSEKLLSKKDKENYTKNLRSQLSSHEQILLFYNSISKLGQPWNSETNNYIVKYKLIKNIPLPLASFGRTPEQKYSSEIDQLRILGEELFEWYKR